VVVSLLAPGAGVAATVTSDAGTWTGTVRGSAAPSEHLTVKVLSGERRGTWSVSASCHGTLVLKNISEGFHHFNRIAATGTTCSGGSGSGVDCLKREGSRLLDEYAPTGNEGWITGLLTHPH
jgi:hypothetical protein